MLSLPIFFGLDYHQNSIQVCVMDQNRKILVHQSVGTMRALIGRFDRFRTGKQLAHFCALCPRNNSSAGKTTTGGLIKAGDELLRMVLIEAAHRLIRYAPHWRDMAKHLRENGKKTCVIVAAVANRWMRKLFHQMTNRNRSRSR